MDRGSSLADNTGKIVNRLAPLHVPTGIDKNSLSPPPTISRVAAPKYTPECWRSVGKALAIAALDLDEINPCSRLGTPPAGGLKLLRGSVAAWCRDHARKEAARAVAGAGRSTTAHSMDGVLQRALPLTRCTAAW